MSRRRAGIALLAIGAHTIMNLALIRTEATSQAWVPVQVLATVAALAVIAWCFGVRRGHKP